MHICMYVCVCSHYSYNDDELESSTGNDRHFRSRLHSLATVTCHNRPHHQDRTGVHPSHHSNTLQTLRHTVTCHNRTHPQDRMGVQSSHPSTPTHTDNYAHITTHVCMHMHMHMHMHMQTHTHTSRIKNSHIHTETQRCTHTHRNRSTHTHRNTYRNERSVPFRSSATVDL